MDGIRSSPEPASYFLAIDNGGTKADYVLADATQELARVRSGTIKRMRTDDATATANLKAALAQLTQLSGVSMRSITRTCIGTAGETVPLVTDWLQAAFAARVSGELVILGDVEIALDAAFQGAPGVLVLAGTGSNVAARLPDGSLTNTGGWGPALADQGSGHRIGLQALRAVFLAIDEGRASTLLQHILAFWGLRDGNELVAYANRIPSPDFSGLAELVLRAADAGDTLAASVLAQEGTDLGYLVRLVMRRLCAASADTAAPTIAFAGSIMTKVLPVRKALLAEVHTEFPAAHALEGAVDPVAGALWRARQG